MNKFLLTASIAASLGMFFSLPLWAQNTADVGKPASNDSDPIPENTQDPSHDHYLAIPEARGRAGPSTYVSPFPRGHLGIELGDEYFSINSHDSVNSGNVRLISDAGATAKLFWNLELSEEWATHAQLSYVGEKVRESAEAPIGNAIGSRTSAEAGAIWKWGSGSRTAFSFSSTQKIFARFVGTSGISLDRVREFQLKVDQEEDLIMTRLLIAGLRASASAFDGGVGDGYKTKTGFGLEGAIFSKGPLFKSKAEIKAEAFYGIWNQNSSLVTQKEKHLGASLSFTWNYGR